MTKKASAKHPHGSDEEEPSLTIKDVAALDRCSQKTVRRAIDADLLEAHYVGPGKRLIRITKAAHVAYRRALRK